MRGQRRRELDALDLLTVIDAVGQSAAEPLAPPVEVYAVDDLVPLARIPETILRRCGPSGRY
jgi:hypothetical protein